MSSQARFSRAPANNLVFRSLGGCFGLRIFRGRIAHGLLTAGYISTVLGTKLPGAGAIFMGASIRFKAPVRVGDLVTAICTVREVIKEKKRVICDCVCKVGENNVIEAEATLMVPARSA